MNEVKTALENDTAQGSPRLITANEAARITGNTGFDASKKGMRRFYLDDPKWHTQIADSTTPSNYAWLFKNTTGCTDYGCDTNSTEETYGYWTSTPYAYSTFDA